MTYKVNLISIDKISSPITAYFDGQVKKFKSGEEMVDFKFDKNYIVDEVTVGCEKIIIKLKFNNQINAVNWIGEESVDFF